jgi:hypothetical protein
MICAAALVAVACGGDDDESFRDCGLGQLRGTWRIRYTETDGNCGPISDETAVFDPDAPLPAGCTRQAQSVSADKCRMDLAWTCPTTDGAGKQAWVMVMLQRSHTRLEGTATVQLDHPSLGSCRSTYSLAITKL